ncbi:MAG: nucleotidyltransferase family protein [bacterium]
MKIAGLILAAGESKRMGTVKQLLPFNDSTLLKRAIANSLESNLDDIFVVLGASSDIITKDLTDLPIQIIYNKHYKEGLGSSISKGVSSLLRYDAIIVLLGDQPRVTSQYINSMITEWKKNTKVILTSRYSKTNGVPALFPKAYFSNLAKCKGDKGAKALLNSDKFPIVPLTNDVDLLDIDTPEEYQNLISNSK